MKTALVTSWQLQKMRVFHVPSSMLKLTLPKHTWEGLNHEVSSAHVHSSVQERSSAAVRDLVHAQMVLSPGPLVQLLQCHRYITLLRKLLWTSRQRQTDGEAVKAGGGGGGVPHVYISPFPALLLLFVFFRCEVGTTHWTQCNETPVKFARFPVTGLIEGRSYIFRVRAVNKAGISLPSRVSEPVAALDPADRARLRSKICFLQVA